MGKGDLNSFFNPRTIAIIGASDHSDKVGGILMKKAMASGLEVVPVNVSHKGIFGRRCYNSVLDYHKSVDLAVIAIPSDFVAGALEECGKKGVKNVIVISSGFSENKNKEIDKILRIAERYGIRFLGTNCFGVCVPRNNLDLTFASSSPKKGSVAFISQSGALWSYAADFDNLGFSSYVSVGNMENLDFNDFVEYFVNDKNTKAIVLYVERFRDGKRFIEVCKRAVANGKKIYAIKGGSSLTGEKAAVSHTASVASDYLIYKGVFKQAGVIQYESFEEILEKASGVKLNLDRVKFPKGRSMIISNAGGAGVLLSDYFSKNNIEVVEKPLDILGTARSEDYARAFRENKHKNFENLYVVVTPQSMTDNENIAIEIAEFSKELKKVGKKVIALFLGKKSVGVALNILKKEGVPCGNSIEGLR